MPAFFIWTIRKLRNFLILYRIRLLRTYIIE
ncbi:hypothetical protein [Escherichia phage UPEC06]|nr:hypothetical protein [Escherichia phage UPEC06]